MNPELPSEILNVPDALENQVVVGRIIIKCL
jgi:hypothetical protein